MARPATSSIRRRRLRREGTGTPAAPVNLSAPAFSNTTPTTGDVITASSFNLGNWSGSPAPTYAYQVKANGTNVSLPYTALVGDVFTVVVTATNTAGSASATSSATSATTAAPAALSALSLSASAIPENSAAGTVVGNVTGKTSGSTLSLANDAGGRFALNGSNQLIAGLVSTDYETATSHSVTIRETLAGATNTPRDTVFTVAVTNVNEAPTITSGTSFSVAENTTAVATLTASDPDAGSSLAWSISGGADAAKFSINSGTGALSFLAAPNYEAPGSSASSNVYTVQVSASDGALSDSKTLTVTVTNVAEITLAALTLSPLTATAGSAYSGTISGKTAGSSITATSSDGTTLAVSGTTVSGTFSSAGSPTVTLTETIADAANSPWTSTATITVSAAAGTNHILMENGSALLTESGNTLTQE